MHFAIGTINIPKRNAIEQVLCNPHLLKGQHAQVIKFHQEFLICRQRSKKSGKGSFGLFSLGLLPRSGAFAEATIASLVPQFSTYYR